ncbi:hypothetical protein Ciccas_011937 [Cichlidogyrus casuarinus]|uniref:Kazal-like domain-containing protein n=1 Tax=Cichlidogyrus casuarinus TaxID=1844966 RepID=A0ABD2PPU3_9PLAT
MLLVIISAAICLSLVTFLFFGCPNTPLAGVNAPYPAELTKYEYVTMFPISCLFSNSTDFPYRVPSNHRNDWQSVNLVAPCNERFNCPVNDWDPMCDSVSGISVVNRCFAGCLGNDTSVSHLLSLSLSSLLRSC